MSTRITFSIEVDVTEGDQHDAEWFADCAAGALREAGYHAFYRFDPADADRIALDRIAYMLKDPDWGVGMLEDIAEFVKVTGRSLANADQRRTWARH